MKILVAVKRVVDYNVHIRIKPDESGVETDNVKMSMNPFDEIAVEEAVKISQANENTEVVAVTVGDAKSEETLRTALAMGCTRAIRIDAPVPANGFEPLTIARILKKVAEQEKPELIITGKQSIDGDYNQTSQMLAAMLDLPQGTFISKLTLKGDKTAEVVREVDGGLETIQLHLPAVVSTDLRLNTPRYASLPNIMKAKSKPLAVQPVGELGVDLTSSLTIEKVTAPAGRPKGEMVANVDELIAKLKQEAKVI